jgi:lipid-A-disaccharide synthase-like uncharacterized protein
LHRLCRSGTILGSNQLLIYSFSKKHTCSIISLAVPVFVPVTFVVLIVVAKVQTFFLSLMNHRVALPSLHMYSLYLSVVC